MSNNKPVYIHAYNCLTPLGYNVSQTVEQLLEGKTAIRRHESADLFPQPFYAAVTDQDILNAEFEKTGIKESYTRLEKMLILSLFPLVEQHRISEDTLLILSTTKGNIELLRNPEIAVEEVQLATLGRKIAGFFGFRKEPVILSNACVSGVMAISVAEGLIRSGHCKDVYLLAGDVVTEFVLSGFNSFQAMSKGCCKPYDKERDGVNLGEAAAAAYISSVPSTSAFEVTGSASVNDANHISGPSRNGDGLYKSISRALQQAQIGSDSVDYISAHGTATIYNDEMESIALHRADLTDVPVNSLKGYFGHTLGASGLLEAIIAMECSRRNVLLPSAGYENHGVSHPINIITEKAEKEIRYILKTASGFGGTNTAVVLKKL